VYGASLVFALIGLINLLQGAGHIQRGTFMLVSAFVLMNLLVLLEVADRLSLKNDLEIARQIQQAMLPGSSYGAAGIEVFGSSRPANTVGGDFYDIIPLDDGRLIVALGDVAGKGSPAALLMALLLAMLRTLVDEALEPADLVARLNVQVCRQAPGTRFITLFLAFYDPLTGEMTYVNAGHTQPLVVRRNRTCERLTEGGIALGMFEHSTYQTGHVSIQPDELVAIYSDGITEAENPHGTPFDEGGLEFALTANLNGTLPSVGAAVVSAVERHTADTRLADDLTILLLRRIAAPAPAGV
jgi:serine phosphatase RsbU (regulator of sigma subunit)